jgi:hypothetical protein
MGKIDKLRTIPKGTKVWSIQLQNNVIFDKDIVVKITNTVYHNDDHVFGFICEELFKHIIPGILEHKNKQLSFRYSETKKFKKSKGMLMM